MSFKREEEIYKINQIKINRIKKTKKNNQYYQELKDKDLVKKWSCRHKHHLFSWVNGLRFENHFLII